MWAFCEKEGYKRMKKSIKQIVSVVAFVLCGLLLFARINDVVRYKTGQATDMMHCLYKQSNGGGMADVVCIGSSHAYWSCQSNYLWNRYGITSLVMGSATQTVASSYYVLQEVLKYEKPKVVLLESYYFYKGKKFLEGGDLVQVRKAFDGLHCDEVKLAMMKDFFGDRSFKENLSLYFPFLKYHSRWNNLKDYDFHPYYFLRGSALKDRVYPMEDPGLPQQATKLAEVNKEYFEKILKLCKENNIELVVYQAPYGHGKTESVAHYMKKQGYNIALESYLEELGIPFLFYQKSGDVTFDYSTDFLNATHLNVIGGCKLSEHLGGWLQQKYGLEDHRGDEAYHSYDEDYEKYKVAYERKITAAE